MKDARNTRIDILQILRLFAASMIILYHTNVTGGRGYFGVQIFFVISGFLAFHTTRTPLPAGRYLLKRCIRLLPLYWLFTVFTFLLLTVRPGISNMSDGDPVHFLFSMLFIPYTGDAGYPLPILAVGWTMQYEVAFTLLFTLSLALSHRFRGLICSLFLLALTAAGTFLKPQSPFLEFYTAPHLLPFLFGLLAGMAWQRIRTSVPDDRPVLSALPAAAAVPVRALLSLLALGSLAFLVIDPALPFPLHHALKCGVPALILFISLLLLAERMAFSSKLLALSNMTYSIFLVEYFTTSAYKRLIPDAPGLPATVLSLAALFAVTFAISVIPYELIEVRLTSRLRKIFLPS